MADITWANRDDSKTPTGATTEVSAAIMNEIKSAVNSKVDKVSGERLINASEIVKLSTLPQIGLYSLRISGATVIIEDVRPIPDLNLTGTYVGVGSIRLNGSGGSFTDKKTIVYAMTNDVVYGYQYAIPTPDRIDILSFDEGLLAIDLKENTVFKIEIFP